MNVTAQAGDTLIQASGVKPLDSQAARQGLRTALRTQRKNITRPLRTRAARAVALRVFHCNAVRRARRVAVYLSMGSELMTAPLIAALRARHIEVFAPALLRDGMRFRALTGRHPQRHRLGMVQPRTGQALRASAMDVLLLPLLGFDSRGTRLGQGGGYYDRALAHCRFRPYRLGLAYAAQQLAELPRAAWDQPLDAVLTERGLRRFNRPLSG